MWPFQKLYTESQLTNKVADAINEVVGELTSELLDSEQFTTVEEATGRAVQLLAEEDAGWVLLSGDKGIISESDRRSMVRRARIESELGTHGKQSIGLWTSFGIGSGVKYRLESAAPPQAKEILDAYWKDPDNTIVLSALGQAASSDKLLRDGELPFVLHGEKDIKVRWLDPLELTIASDPEDKYMPRYYVRRYCKPGETKETVVIYPNYINKDGDYDGVTADNKRYNKAMSDASLDNKTAVVQMVKLNNRLERPLPLIAAQLPWDQAFRRFIKSRVNIQQALARYAYKVKHGKGAAAGTALKAKLNTTVGSVGTDTNPPPTSGSTFVENMAATLTNMKQETGASAAQIDGNMLINQIGAAAGLYPHYLGAGDAFKLATATAMEAPMRKQFEQYGGLWTSGYEAQLEYVLRRAGIENVGVTCETPEVFPQQVTETVDAIVKLCTVYPKISTGDDVLKKGLSLVKIPNIEKALENMIDVAPVSEVGQRKSQAAAMLLKLVREAKVEIEEGGGGNNG